MRGERAFKDESIQEDNPFGVEVIMLFHKDNCRVFEAFRGYWAASDSNILASRYSKWWYEKTGNYFNFYCVVQR
ncbi:hypothetical protein DMA11_17330 [Marinilabiliaceae bacterium JC017]|nr:hypothetical protein DMA11_17330 [Marinilabiliaceae bacterium JC017]